MKTYNMNYNKLKKQELIDKLKFSDEKIRELESMEYNEKLMIEQSPDSMIYLDNYFKVVYLNDECKKLLKYSLNEISGEHINIISKEKNIEEHIKKDNNDLYSIEFNANKKDNSKFYCEMKISSLYDSEGNKYGYISIIRDISEFKKAQFLLRQSENKYRTIIENSNDNIIITKNGKILFINRAVEKTTGYKKEDVIGTNFINYITKKDREKVLDFHYRRMKNENISNIYESILIDKYGRKIYVELNNSVIDLDGEKCIISFVRNITERKNNQIKKEKDYEDKLKYQKEAMDLAMDGIAILDKNKNYIYINDAYIKMNGYNDDSEFINNNWSIVYDESEIVKITKNLNGDSTWIGEVKGKKKNNKYYDQEISISILEDGGVITLIRDITKSKQTENRLRKSKEKAEEADKLKSSFLANMSHEIRTPINVIKGFSDIINESKISKKEIKKLTKVIKRKSDELLNLLNDILDLSKIESNQVKPNYTPFSLNNLIEDISISTKNRIKELKKNISIKTYCYFEDNEDIIISDENRLKQVLNNLIDNSIKFTNKGYIEIGYVPVDDKFEKDIDNEDINNENFHNFSEKINMNNMSIKFFVKDTGIGIPKEKQKMIFERFRQADESINSTYGGTGLGLTICKKIIELLKGYITINSDLNYGTVFSFVIPIKSNSNTMFLKKEKINSIKDVNWKNKTALIVEDDNDNIDLLKLYLKKTKIKLLIAKSGKEAENIFKKNKNVINIILMDIRMAGQDGIETTKKIKKIKDVPIIAQTAYAMKGDKEKFMFYGCDNYISKPIKKEELLNKMDNHIKKYNLSEEKNNNFTFFIRNFFNILFK